jgi:protein-S-isoprenylcysteine O-methyltransferase Ste14
MGGVALGAYLVFFVGTVGVRAALNRRRTGSAGLEGIGGRVGSAEWCAGAMSVVAVLVGLIAPAAQLAGTVDPLAVLDGWPVWTLGGLLGVAGTVATGLAQQAMGTSFRVGVDPRKVAALVTTGPFALVRNPVFTAMITAVAGFTLLAPNALATAGLVTLVVAVQMQVRIVEEPYLRRVHGATYAEYARRVGRLLSGFGRLNESDPTRDVAG